MASLASKMYKIIQFRPGLRSAHQWGRIRRSPRPSNRLGRGKPPPHSQPPRRLRRLAVDSFGVEPSAPGALRRLDSNPQWEFLATPLVINVITLAQ